MSSEIRYVYNDRGERTDVIIPILIWMKEIEPILDLKFEKKQGFDPSRYVGIVNYQGTIEELEIEILAMRDEWDRI